MTSAQRAVSTGPQNVPLTAPFPVDPRITVGTLPNGLRYYLRANKQPEGRAELRLVVNAGSVLEDDDQRGLAHFVEHMASTARGTSRSRTSSRSCSRLGMRFGAHINANTSFDETVYQLQIPTDDPRVIDRSFLILEDWAHDVSFDPEEIDKERGVILEEWRLGLGAGRAHAGRAAARAAQGLALRRAPADRQAGDHPERSRHDRLKKFYTDWYRPDLMAVVAVGDFDPAADRNPDQIALRVDPGARSTRRPRPTYDVPDQPGTRYSVATDPEATSTVVSVSSMMAASDQTTVGAYRQQTIERVFSGLLSARLAEIAQKPDAPFLDAETNRGLFVRTAEATTLSALVADGGVERGLAALFTEADRVARFGFTQTELDRYRAEPAAGLLAARRLQRRAHVAVARRRVHPQLHAAGADSRHRLRERPRAAVPPGDHARRREQARAATGCRIATGSSSVSAPKKAGVDGARRGEARGRHQGRRRRRADGVRGHASARRRSSRRCPSPAPLRRRATKAPGITEWTLSNGVRVVLEPTTFKQDEILFRAFSPGGTSLAVRSGLRRGGNGGPDRVRGRTRHALGHRRRQEARRQDRRRASRHRRDVRRAERPGRCGAISKRCFS